MVLGGIGSHHEADARYGEQLLVLGEVRAVDGSVGHRRPNEGQSPAAERACNPDSALSTEVQPPWCSHSNATMRGCGPMTERTAWKGGRNQAISVAKKISTTATSRLILRSTVRAKYFEKLFRLNDAQGYKVARVTHSKDGSGVFPSGPGLTKHGWKSSSSASRHGQTLVG